MNRIFFKNREKENPEQDVRDISKAQKCDLILFRCKGTYFPANIQEISGFFLIISEKYGKTYKNNS